MQASAVRIPLNPRPAAYCPVESKWLESKSWKRYFYLSVLMQVLDRHWHAYYCTCRSSALL